MLGNLHLGTPLREPRRSAQGQLARLGTDSLTSQLPRNLYGNHHPLDVRATQTCLVASLPTANSGRLLSVCHPRVNPGQRSGNALVNGLRLCETLAGQYSAAAAVFFWNEVHTEALLEGPKRRLREPRDQVATHQRKSLDMARLPLVRTPRTESLNPLPGLALGWSLDPATSGSFP